MTLSAKKTIALLLAGLLLFSGCNSGTVPQGEENGKQDDTANTGETTPAETEPEVPDDYTLRMQVEDSLPADADLGGEPSISRICRRIRTTHWATKTARMWSATRYTRETPW